MNILLLAPRHGTQIKVDTFPFGLACISTALKQNGHTVVCVNEILLDEPLESHLHRLSSTTKFDVIGIGGFSFAYWQIQQCLDAAARAFPEAVRILGGRIVTCSPEMIMQALQPDFGVIGLGEETIVALLAELEKGDYEKARRVEGTVHFDRATKRIGFAEPRTPSETAVWDPDYAAFGYDRFLECGNTHLFNTLPVDNPRPGVVFTSRSCPFHCTFCYHTNVKYQPFPMEMCVRTIDRLVSEFSVNFILVYDDLFYTRNDTQRLSVFAAEMQKRGLRWSCQSRASEITREAAKILKDSGCAALSFGIENISDSILKSMKKGITRAQIENGIAIAREMNMPTGGNILIGDPAETWETLTENLAWWTNHVHELDVNLVYIQTLPGSELYDLAKSRGLITDEIAYCTNENFVEKKFQLNLTTLPDDVVNNVRRYLYQMLAIHRYVTGMLLRFSFIKKSTRHRFDLFHIEAICPYCGRTEQRNIRVEPESDIALVGCKHCTRVFKTPNPSLLHEHPSLPWRLYVSKFPTHALSTLYRKRGGTAEEIAEFVSPKN